MKKNITLTFGLLACFLFGYAQTAKLELAKSFNLDGNSTIVLILPGEANTVVWDKPHVNVSVEINIDNIGQKTADELARVGRYDLTSESKDLGMVISSPNTRKKVRIRGQELQETMRYTVYIPKDTKIQISGPDANVLAAGNK